MSGVRRNSNQGFTLVELMIAVLIVGILAGIGYPSYQNHIRTSRRAEAQSDLLQLAAFLERNFTLTNRFDLNPAGNPIALPFLQSPQNGANVVYDISFTKTAATFTLRATPRNNSPQAVDGFLELNHDGSRAWDRNNNSVIDPGENDWER